MVVLFITDDNWPRVSAGPDRDPLARDQARTRQIVRRLMDGCEPGRAGGDTAACAAAACDDLYRNLSRWVGPDGSHALFKRALAEKRAEHPALEQIQLRAHSDPYMDGVGEALVEHGDAATADAFESLLFSLVELLGRLVGDDMASKLIEQSLAAPKPGAQRPLAERAEP